MHRRSLDPMTIARSNPTRQSPARALHTVSDISLKEPLPMTKLDFVVLASVFGIATFACSSASDPSPGVVSSAIEVPTSWPPPPPPTPPATIACVQPVTDCKGNAICEECLNAGECAEGPDPFWLDSPPAAPEGCYCMDGLGGPSGWPSCSVPLCCDAFGPGLHWDATVCESTGTPFDACVSDCSAGQTYCSGHCVELAFDNENCGSCGQACGSGLTCHEGDCVANCNNRIDCLGSAGRSSANGR
jgi:hypothetical protein